MWFSAIVDNDKVEVGDDVAGVVSDNANTAPTSSRAAAAALPPPIHFNSRRSPIYCTKACVATSQPLATSIGLHILRGCGGNAADASVAIAAALAVVSFSLVW